MEFQNNVLSNQRNLASTSPPRPCTPFQELSTNLSTISSSTDVSRLSDCDSVPKNYNFHNTGNTFQYISSVPQKQFEYLSATSNQQPPMSILPQPTTAFQQAALQQNCVSIGDKGDKLEPQYPELSMLVIWEWMKRQDEKLKTLQEQIFHIPEHTAEPCQTEQQLLHLSNQEVISPCKSKPSDSLCYTTESQGTFQLLSCLQTQTEMIQKLQEQNQKLQEHNQKLLEEKTQFQQWNQELKYKLLLTNQKKSGKLDELACSDGNQSQSKTKSPDPGQGKQKKTCKNPEANVVFQEEKEIEKTSTSTMTSLVYDGPEKVVFQKLTTVTTDFKKQSNGVSFNKDSTPENRPPFKEASSSQKKCRKCGKCSPMNQITTSKSPHLNATKSGSKKMLKNTPEREHIIQQNFEKNTEAHNLNSDENLLPRYENILRNLNGNNLNCNETTPQHKPASKPSAKGRKKLSLPFDEDVSPKTKEHHHLNRSKSPSTASDSSNDSLSRQKDISANDTDLETEKDKCISLYGLASPNVTNGTRKYLEDNGLVLNRSENNRKIEKSKTTLVKRYLR